MYNLIKTIDAWNDAQVAGVVARTVALHGFGARTAGEAVAIAADGRIEGGLLAGAADEELFSTAKQFLSEGAAVTRRVGIRITDADAVAAGFACGGRADILFLSTQAISPELADAFRSGQPVVLATPTDSPRTLTLDRGGALVGDLGTEEITTAVAEQARELFATAQAATRSVTIGETDVFLECFVPQTHLLVIGGGMLAEALQAQAKLLGWATVVTDDNDEAAAAQAITSMHASDALVLLTHNRDIDGPLLAAAIRQGVGYIGALGSRGNQRLRAGRLEAQGLSAEEIALVHGPVGLDIGAANPAETALAICAEAVMTHAGRNAQSLQDTTGPINR